VCAIHGDPCFLEGDLLFVRRHSLTFIALHVFESSDSSSFGMSNVAFLASSSRTLLVSVSNGCLVLPQYGAGCPTEQIGLSSPLSSQVSSIPWGMDPGEKKTWKRTCAPHYLRCGEAPHAFGRSSREERGDGRCKEDATDTKEWERGSSTTAVVVYTWEEGGAKELQACSFDTGMGAVRSHDRRSKQWKLRGKSTKCSRER